MSSNTESSCWPLLPPLPGVFPILDPCLNLPAGQAKAAAELPPSSCPGGHNTPVTSDLSQQGLASSASFPGSPKLQTPHCISCLLNCEVASSGGLHCQATRKGGGARTPVISSRLGNRSTKPPHQSECPAPWFPPAPEVGNPVRPGLIHARFTVRPACTAVFPARAIPVGGRTARPLLAPAALPQSWGS